MNDADFAAADVLEGIEATQAVGLTPLKVNMIVKRGTNNQEIVPMARHFKNSGAVLRFIEYMDVGTSNGWNMSEVLPSAQVVDLIDAHFPLEPLEAHTAAETAQRWGYRDGSGEIGVISSVTRAFCGSCTQARLSTEGKLYLCLFAMAGHDLRGLIRGGASDEEVATAIARIWEARGDRYSQLRGSASRCRISAADGGGSLVQATLNAHSSSDVTALVLAGGRGSRMGGIDKGMQPFRGEPLALHVMRRLAPQAGAMLISANRSIDDYTCLGAPFGASVIADTRADYPGPLAGIAAALHTAATEFVLTAPCDAPFVDEHLGAALMQAVDASGDVMAHPVFALVRTALADNLDAWLNAGERKVRAWYACHKAAEVQFHEERAFYNINDLQQLAELERS